MLVGVRAAARTIRSLPHQAEDSRRAGGAGRGEEHIPFGAVVADSFYGEDRQFKRSVGKMGVGYVLALKKKLHSWYRWEGEKGNTQSCFIMIGLLTRCSPSASIAFTSRYTIRISFYPPVSPDGRTVP
jgi:hypothetical protein